MCVKIIGFLLAALIAVGAIFASCCFKAPFDATTLVEQLEKEQWGAGDTNNNADTSIKPFKIKFEENVISDLKHRLDNVRLTKPLSGVQQQYGMNTNLLKDVINYWKTQYNWSAREKYLNKYPHFKTKIQGLNIHYIHVKPKNANGKQIVPLLVLHGWPGSVREFYDIIPLLTEPRSNYDFVFELIVPSLVGFGFSDGADKPGFGAAQDAVIFKLLMQRLGYEKFYAQGGDFGAIIIQEMGKLYPNNLLGLHSNMCFISSGTSLIKYILGSFYPSAFAPPGFLERTYPMSKTLSKLLEESGYFHIQATKPDTVGVGLGDSPAGLAAYILEKFTTGTNVIYQERLDGGLKEKFTFDDLLDNVMIYWVTNSMTTAVRLYSETFSASQVALGLRKAVVTPPSACARFVNDIHYQPDWVLKEVFVNLIHGQDFTNAGHFAAMEAPKTLAGDVFTAIDKMRKLNTKANV